MGINTEMVFLMSSLEERGHLTDKRRVIELGAQEVCAHPDSLLAAERQCWGGARGAAPRSAADFYVRYGFAEYLSLDAGGVGTPGKLIADLNRPLEPGLPLGEAFDLVTNLGTSEHCFNQAQFFATMHSLCGDGGLMLHVLCAQGLVNHGYFNYHPRFVQELALANGYDIIELSFTVDFTAQLIPYSLASFRTFDSRDVMLYAVFRKRGNGPFAAPFDGMFAALNQVSGYGGGGGERSAEFRPYIKTTWANATAPDAYGRGPMLPAVTNWDWLRRRIRGFVSGSWPAG